MFTRAFPRLAATRNKSSSERPLPSTAASVASCGLPRQLPVLVQNQGIHSRQRSSSSALRTITPASPAADRTMMYIGVAITRTGQAMNQH